MISSPAKTISLRRRPLVIAGQWLLFVAMPAGLIGISVAAAIESGWNWRALVFGGPLAALGAGMLLLFRPYAIGRAKYLVLAARTLSVEVGAGTQRCEWQDISSINVRTQSIKGATAEVLEITLNAPSGVPYPWISIGDAYTISLRAIEAELNAWKAAAPKPGSFATPQFDTANATIERDRRSLIGFALAWVLLGPLLALAMVMGMVSRRHLRQRQQ